MSVVEKLIPKLLWKHFSEISKIPRCSKHEEKIRQYLLNFGKKQGLKVKTDKIGNIVILKPASPGYTNKPTIILQGHMDMVCEKNSDVIHDFTKDPIKMKIKGDILTAEGTTLGADNGIGIATSLAILEDTTLRHGPLEALFTVDEETGLTGAFSLESGMVSGKIMLNLDSEDFGVITVGCAGGGDSTITLPITTEPLTSGDLVSLLIKVSGLRGGHSGVDIHEQRGNAIKLLNRILWEESQKFSFYLTEIRGGDKHNAIPREAYAKISLNKKDKTGFLTQINKISDDILKEIRPIDPKFQVEVTAIDRLDTTFSKASQQNLLHLLQGLPHGVDKRSYDIPDLVETSTNLATVSIKDKKATIGMSSRSSIKTALQDLRNRIHAIAALSGAHVEEGEPYPGWKPNLDSPALALSKRTFAQMFGREPKIEAIHAGLECGIIGEKHPGMDMVSIGPTIKYPHSPEEQVHLETVEKFYQFVLKILEVV